MTSEKIFIMGGSSGIGLAAAAHFLQLGHEVVIAGRSQSRLEAARQSLTGDISTRLLDAANPDEVRKVFAAGGAFDHLVLAVGSHQGAGPFASVNLSAVKQGFAEKVFPHFDCAQAALPHLRKNGSITFVSAVSAHAALPGTAGLGAANAAIAALVPILAAELKPLRVNGISPGVIDTPWWDFLPAEEKSEVFAGFASKTPIGRIGQAKDIAEAIAFLVTNTFMNGHVLICDGGLRLTG